MDSPLEFEIGMVRFMGRASSEKRKKREERKIGLNEIETQEDFRVQAMSMRKKEERILVSVKSLDF